MRGICALLFACLLLQGAVSLAAKDSTGVGCICGKVTSADTGSTIPFAVVYLAGTTKGCQTDTSGVFCICGLTAGVYTVVGATAGYSSVAVEGVEVAAACTSWVTFCLEETIIVIDGCPIVPRAKWRLRIYETQSMYQLTAEHIRYMPSGDVYDILRKRGGVTIR